MGSSSPGSTSHNPLSARLQTRRQATGAYHGALTPATSPGPLSSLSLVSLPMVLPPLNHAPWFFLSSCHPLYQGSDPSSRQSSSLPTARIKRLTSSKTPPPQFPQQPFCQGSDLMEKWPSRPVQMPNGHLPITQAMPWFHVETHTPPGMWKA